MKFKVKILSVVVVSLMGHAASVGQSAGEASFDLDEDIVQRYAYSNWCGRTRMVYPRLVQDWYLPDLSLPTNGLNNVTVVNDREVSSAFSRLLVANQDRELLRVDTRVCTGVEEAHEAIIRWFSRMTKPFCYPQVTNDIGDVLFYRQHPSGGCSASFARNNVFVWIRSHMPSCGNRHHGSTPDARRMETSTCFAMLVAEQDPILESIHTKTLFRVKTAKSRPLLNL